MRADGRGDLIREAAALKASNLQLAESPMAGREAVEVADDAVREAAAAPPPLSDAALLEICRHARVRVDGRIVDMSTATVASVGLEDDDNVDVDVAFETCPLCLRTFPERVRVCFSCGAGTGACPRDALPWAPLEGVVSGARLPRGPTTDGAADPPSRRRSSSGGMLAAATDVTVPAAAGAGARGGDGGGSGPPALPPVAQDGARAAIARGALVSNAQLSRKRPVRPIIAPIPSWPSAEWQRTLWMLFDLTLSKCEAEGAPNQTKPKANPKSDPSPNPNQARKPTQTQPKPNPTPNPPWQIL